MSPRTAVLAVAILLVLPSVATGHGSLQTQVETLSREIAVRQDDASLYLRRGELHRLDRNWAAAQADYDAAERIDPSRLEVQRCRAALWLDAGDPGRALAALDTFVASRPEDAAARLLRARALHALGRDVEAGADYDRAITLMSDPRPEHYLESAQWWREAGDTDRARASLDAGIARLGPTVALEQARAEFDVPIAPAPPGSQVSSPEPIAIAGDATPPQVAATTLVPARGTWRYLATPTSQGTSWRGVLYDDSTWPSGPGVLGFGESYIATQVPWGSNQNNRYTTTYFRKSFVLNQDPSTLQSLSLLANYDDGFVAYLNGVEVARRGLPTGTVSYGTFALSHEGGGYEPIDLSAFIGNLAPGTNVLAVEVHQTSLSSSDLVWDAELFHGLRLVRGPYLQIATPTSVMVRWRTSTATNSRVRYGKSAEALMSVVDDLALTTEHVVTLTGFTPDTRTYYSVGTTSETLAGGDTEHYFITPPALGADKPTRIWVLGDSGEVGATQNAVRDAYATYSADRVTDVWLMLGDNAYETGNDAEFQVGLFDPYKNFLRNCVLWPTRGNHELLFAGDNNDYYDIFSMPAAGQAGGLPSGTEAYYAFDHGNIHFVCLDSEGSNRSPGGAMMTWLAADLDANASDWRIVYWHHPPYTKGSHDSDNDQDSGGRMRDMRANALPILESLGADLVLTGHSHSYERSFLLDGHYGPSSTLTAAMKLDPGDGRPGSSTGAYAKPTVGGAPREGAVYAVAGSSSHTGGGLLNHPAHFISMNVPGSMVIDVEGNELTARFLDNMGAVRDYFMIVKGPGGAPVGVAAEPRLALRLEAGPNPSHGGLHFTYTIPHAGNVRLTLHDAAGHRVATLVEVARPAGRHTIEWNGRDQNGIEVAPGVYFGRLEFAGETCQGKIVLTR